MRRLVYLLKSTNDVKYQNVFLKKSVDEEILKWYIIKVASER